MSKRFLFNSISTNDSGVCQRVSSFRESIMESHVAVVAAVSQLDLAWIVEPLVTFEVAIAFELLRALLAFKSLRKLKKSEKFELRNV